MNHIVALSGGKDSVAMALALRQYEPENRYTYVCTPTGWELPDMQEHFRRLEDMLEAPILHLPARSLSELVEIQHALPNWRMRWCTRMIKIKPFELYIRAQVPATVYIGIRADESGDREGVDYDRLPGITRRFPLDEWGWTLQDVLSYLDCRGVKIPERTDCDACFFQTLFEWYLFWQRYPDRWMERETLEEKFGHTFRSKDRDSWPTSMKGLRECFEAGHIPQDRRKQRSQMCAVCAR